MNGRRIKIGNTKYTRAQKEEILRLFNLRYSVEKIARILLTGAKALRFEIFLASRSGYYSIEESDSFYFFTGSVLEEEIILMEEMHREKKSLHEIAYALHRSIHTVAGYFDPGKPKNMRCIDRIREEGESGRCKPAPPFSITSKFLEIEEKIMMLSQQLEIITNTMEKIYDTRN